MKPVACLWHCATLFAFIAILTSGARVSGADEPAASPSNFAETDYLQHIRPILRARCATCHNEAEQGGGLRLDLAAELMKGGESGPAVVPGRSQESRLILAVLQTGDLKMPPPEEAKPLDEAQINTFRRWIDQGAKIPDDESQVSHWAFQEPVRAEVPMVADGDESATDKPDSNPIDAFIAAQHQQHQLKPLQAASGHVQLRRLYLDLIGLPPTPEQLTAFLNDDSPNAWEKVVDELLASPHYGERWGRHWMDVWRYSDWDGYGAEVRESKPHIWRWRDWIIESLNADKPYDQMIVEMLAADEVAPDDPQALRATGYLVRNWYVFNRNTWVDNTIEHTGKAFLGMTFNCARCHDHMYDPVSQSEYYQLRAFFEPHDVRTDRVPGQSDVSKDGLVRVFDLNAAAPTLLFVRGDEKNPLKDKPLSPHVPAVFGQNHMNVMPVELPPTAYYPGLQSFITNEALSTAEAEVQTATGAHSTAQQAESAIPLAEKKLAVAAAAMSFAKARIAADRANYSKPPAADAKELSLAAGKAERTLTVLQEQFKLLTAEQTLTAARVARDLATASVVLSPDGAAAPNEKLTKAVTDAEAAVAAAKTAIEAAEKSLAEPFEAYTRLTPVYPATSSGRRLALARWIASRDNPLTARVAVNHLWLRHFHQPLVPTVFDFGMNGKPASHPELLDWLACELMDNGWKMKPLHRLMVTSAAYRMASASPASDLDTGSANTLRDPENRFLWRQNSYRMEAEVVRDATLHVSGQLDITMSGPDLDPTAGLTLARRSVYFRTSKEKKMTFLSTFDSPNPVECYQRAESISPQQSLAMSNSSLTLAQSRITAANLSREIAVSPSENTDNQFVIQAFRRVLSRHPTEAETTECVRFLGEQAEQFAPEKPLTAFAGGGDNPVKPSADPTQRARENLVHVLFNHNDFITVR